MDTQRPQAARELIESERLARISRSLHSAWRDAVRTPWRNFRRRLRGALMSSAGVPVALDETTTLAAVPFEGRLPPPLTQCEVVAPAQYRTRTHPLSVNSRDHSERLHYIEHTVHAPAMTLEHLVDQYWFPAFGVLISPQGRIWRHSFLVPFREGYLSSIKAIADAPRPDGTGELRLHLERLRSAPRIAGEHLLIAGSDKHNYGHYLHDIVPLIDLGAKMRTPMLTWSLRPWQRAADRPARASPRGSSARSGRGPSFSNMRSRPTGSPASAARTRIPRAANCSRGSSPTCASTLRR